MGDGLAIIIYPFFFLTGAVFSIVLWIGAWLLLPKWLRNRGTIRNAVGWKDYASSVLIWARE